MSNIKSVKILSNRMLVVLWMVMIINPISHAILWFLTTLNNESLFYSISDIPSGVLIPLGFEISVVGYIISNISIVVISFMTFELIKLFKLYRDGHIFTNGNVNCYRKIANLIIAYVVFGYVEEILLGLVLTFDNEYIDIGVSFSDADLAMLVSGFIIRIIAKVMAEGKVIHEEQSMTI